MSGPIDSELTWCQETEEQSGQLVLVRNGTQVPETLCGRATGTSELAGQAILTLTPGDTLSLKNVGNTALTVTPGGPDRLNTESGITGERRRRRSPALLLFALVALTSTGSASANPARGQRTVSPSQQLATLLSPHEARSRPTPLSASLGLVPARTPLTEQRTVLPVLAQNGQWLRVLLPGRPNGHTGWIRSRATSRADTDWRIVVDESTRRVTVYRAGRVMRVFTAIVGKPTTPTLRGQFFVEESIALLGWEPGAPFALALSARSNVYQEFHGGPGQIALHGLENVGGVLGTAASHGCVRLGNDAMRWLVYRVGPGSPVTITS